MLMDRHERIDRSRYPHIAALADDATWYRNATTVNGATTMAVPAILSATSSEYRSAADSAYPPRHVFTLLGDSHAMTQPNAPSLPREACLPRPGRPTLLRLAFFSLHPARSRGSSADAGRRSSPCTRRRPPASFRDVLNVPTCSAPRTGIRLLFVTLLLLIPLYRDRTALAFLLIALPHLPWCTSRSGQQSSTRPVHSRVSRPIVGAGPFFPCLGLRDSAPSGYLTGPSARSSRRLRAVGSTDRALVLVSADHGSASVRASASRPTAGNGATSPACRC